MFPPGTGQLSHAVCTNQVTERGHAPPGLSAQTWMWQEKDTR